MSVRRLVIYDYDGTLRRNQTEPPAEFLTGKTNRTYLWMLTVESVQGTPDPVIVSKIKRDLADPDTKVVLLTARPIKAKKPVNKSLTDIGITVSDQVYDAQDKSVKVQELLKRYKPTDELVVYEDDQKQLAKIEETTKGLSLRTVLNHVKKPSKPKSKSADRPIPLASTAKVFKTLESKGVKDIIVGFSGGKDSLTVLDLCVKAFGAEHVKVFFLYTLPGLECESKLVDLPTKRYGIPVIQYPLPEIIAMIKNGYARSTPPSLSAILDRKYGWREIEKLIRFKTGARWLAYGHRQQDSLHRRGMLSRCEGVWDTAYTSDKPIQRSFPIWEWTHKHVLAYLEKHKLPIPHMFGSGVINTSGLSLMDAETLIYVRDNYPDDYKRLKRVFPGLDTPIFRQEVLQRTFAQFEESDDNAGVRSPMELQQTSELFETELAKILRLDKTRLNFPVDWICTHGDVDVGVELKVLNKAEAAQSRVQMRPEAKARKLAWLSEHSIKRRVGITVLIDNRDNYANGKYKQHYSGHRIYMQSGFGAFRLSTMKKLDNLSHLVKLIYNDANKIPDADKQFQAILERTYGVD